MRNSLHNFVMREAAACSRMKPKPDEPVLTPAQDKWLRRGNDLGQIIWHGPRGYGRSVYERVMNALQAKGLVAPNAYDEYELTEAGRSIVSNRKPL